MRKKYGKASGKFLPIICILFSLLFACFALLQLEKKLLPPLREISHIQCKALANQVIDAATAEILESMTLSQESLLLETESGSCTANTMLVNRFCSALSSRITQALAAPPNEVIEIPLGAATNIAFLANKGPTISFTLLPRGSVEVDYETAFQSVGINQINYKIWVNLAIDVKIVNPLYQESLRLERKMMLADLIFSGKVPSHYFQIAQPNSPLA